MTKKEGIKFGINKEGRDPSAEAGLIEAEEGIPWSDQVEKAEKGERIEEILNDLKTVDAIVEAEYPTDEEMCDRIGRKHGLGAAEVAVLSNRLAKRERDSIH